METSTLTPRQKYAAAALFALALHQSQVDRTRHSYPLVSLINEQGMSANESVSASDHPWLLLDENSSLLSPIFRYYVQKHSSFDTFIIHLHGD